MRLRTRKSLRNKRKKRSKRSKRNSLMKPMKDRKQSMLDSQKRKLKPMLRVNARSLKKSRQ